MNKLLTKKRKKAATAPFTDKIPLIADIVLNSVDRNIIQKVYLFGSYAYGEPTEDSDIDVFVVTDKVFDKLGVYGNIAGRLRENGLIPCDLLVSNEEDFERGIKLNGRGIESTVTKYGRLLYER